MHPFLEKVQVVATKTNISFGKRTVQTLLMHQSLTAHSDHFRSLQHVLKQKSSRTFSVAPNTQKLLINILFECVDLINKKLLYYILYKAKVGHEQP